MPRDTRDISDLTKLLDYYMQYRFVCALLLLLAMDSNGHHGPVAEGALIVIMMFIVPVTRIDCDHPKFQYIFSLSTIFSECLMLKLGYISRPSSMPVPSLTIRIDRSSELKLY